jgi:hypothetical protein
LKNDGIICIPAYNNFFYRRSGHHSGINGEEGGLW